MTDKIVYFEAHCIGKNIDWAENEENNNNVNFQSFGCSAKRFPNLKMVVDHISKPIMSLGKESGLQGWR